MDKSSQLVSSEECEKLRSALVAAQESAAVQLLLECCLPRDEAERVSLFLWLADTHRLFELTFLMPGFWNSSYPENLELSLEQETTAF